MSRAEVAPKQQVSSPRKCGEVNSRARERGWSRSVSVLQELEGCNIISRYDITLSCCLHRGNMEGGQRGGGGLVARMAGSLGRLVLCEIW